MSEISNVARLSAPFHASLKSVASSREGSRPATAQPPETQSPDLKAKRPSTSLASVPHLSLTSLRSRPGSARAGALCRSSSQTITSSPFRQSRRDAASRYSKYDELAGRTPEYESDDSDFPEYVDLHMDRPNEKRDRREDSGEENTSFYPVSILMDATKE